MATKYGMFQENVYLRPEPPAAGDPAASTGARSRGGSAGATATADRDGINFKITVARTGKNNDATFDKFQSLHTGDKYVDALSRTLQAKNEAKKKQVAVAPFKAASPMKKSAGLGDYYGTISGKTEYVPGSTVFAQKTRAEVHGQPKGFYTSPAKKGTYGFNKTTLSERQGYKGVACEYEYQHEPEELQRERRRLEREADKAARPTLAPFKPANPPKKGGPGVPNTTISKGKGVAGEWEYLILPENKPAHSPAAAAGGEGGKAADSGPAFKPVSLKPKHLGRQPEYIHDPEGPRIEAEHAKKKAEIARLAHSGAWKPNQGPKTDMVRSIVRMNL